MLLDVPQPRDALAPLRAEHASDVQALDLEFQEVGFSGEDVDDHLLDLLVLTKHGKTGYLQDSSDIVKLTLRLRIASRTASSIPGNRSGAEVCPRTGHRSTGAVARTSGIVL